MSGIGIYQEALAEAGVAVPEILLPGPGCDRTKWSVIACDQFTSLPAYWREVEALVGDAPSSLRLILPEVFLNDRFSERVAAIHAKMGEYLDGGVFAPPFTGFVLTERRLPTGTRRGLIVALDLERYEFEAGAVSLTRATEATVKDRLPPRVQIRRGAALELPHALALVNDPADALIGPLAEAASGGGEFMGERLTPLYDFDLIAGGGHVRGFGLDGIQAAGHVARAWGRLLNEARAAAAGSLSGSMLFAIGDGNHSLAAAKAHWDELQTKLPADGRERHPARFALVELVNLHSDAVQFEPIHRALFRADPEAVLAELRRCFAGRGVSVSADAAPESGGDGVGRGDYGGGCSGDGSVGSGGGFVFPMLWGGGRRARLRIDKPEALLPVAELQGFLDAFCARHPEAALDYIHGADELSRLANEEGCFCFILPKINKHGFFSSVAIDGLLPRKAFSMGDARDKRYYLEARRIDGRPPS
ncbi:MAG: DUF1015 domain-containing protein [Clostridiales bacterium]|nr:DUF1015 domain-containing protein [Clostridiales bacterium]